MSLFDEPDSRSGERGPLADRMRPQDLEEFVGQTRVVGPGTALREAIEQDRISSIILWGPPGCGKTTLARIVAKRTRASFVPFSAVTAGITEVRRVMAEAERRRRATGQHTILFVDEIHRFNKAQQDAFLPYVEQGTVTLIGATTENPSFEVNSALLSRSRVYRLEMLTERDLSRLLTRALADRERGLGDAGVEVPAALLDTIARQSQGDARAALNLLELTVNTAAARGVTVVDEKLLQDTAQRLALYYDRAGEEHFNLISALHKSMRNSDADATLYWLARMLESGEEPLYLARRIVRFASEDVGLADPRALDLAVAARDAVHFLGLPEGELALAEAAVYCALAPKSNALYRAWGEIRQTLRQGATEPVPLELRNARTPLMQAEGYGAGYQYAHDEEDAITTLECLPSALRERRFYHPVPRGFEKELGQRLEDWRAARDRKRRDESS